MKRILVGLLLIPALGGAALAAQPTARAPHRFTGAELMAVAAVKLPAARATALRARPGKITDEELEKEGGGSGLRYSFDIVSGGRTFEVGVDAKTGAVLENKVEGKNPD